MNGEWPHDAAAHIAVLGVDRHLFVELLGFRVSPPGYLTHRQLGRELEIDRDYAIIVVGDVHHFNGLIVDYVRAAGFDGHAGFA